MRTLSRSCIVILAAMAPSTAAVAQSQLRFPLETVERAADRVGLAPVGERIAQVAGLSHVVLTGVPIPGGELDVELERIDLAARRFRYRVDGVEVGDLTAGQDLSVWFGHVRGQPDDQVALSFSQVGCRGWIERGSELFHVACGAGAGGDWSHPTVTVMSEAALLAMGASPPPNCESESLAANTSQPAPTPSPSLLNAALSLSPALLEARVCVETDYQLNQVFGGSLAAESSYVTTLLAWVSYRYEEQIQTVLTYPYVAFYTSSNDPWISADVGGNSIDLLYEFQGAWQNNLPAGGDLAAFLSGGSLGGGVAWLPGLCNAPYNFSVAGNINAGVSFPVSVNSGNWDFMVVAHEIGHNFGAPHTHDYCPTPADQCAPSGYFGACQNTQACITNGTLMSYCHLCPGGLSSVTTYFHPWSALDMRTWAENSCLPLHCASPVAYCTAKINSQGCAPSIDAFGHPTFGGLDNFVIAATNVLNNKNGVLYWGLSSSAGPFQGGVMCVAAPTVRTGVQLSGGAPGADDCSGSYAFAFTHAYALSSGLSAGTTCYAQYWSRDPASPSATGLTNALQFTLCD